MYSNSSQFQSNQILSYLMQLRHLKTKNNMLKNLFLLALTITTTNDEVTTTKKEIKYNIFSIPVASTFTPAKGKAAVVDKAPPVKLYDNYASAGFGTYTTILGEVYLNHALNRNESVGGYLNYHSSQGGIDGLLLDDKVTKTKCLIGMACRSLFLLKKLQIH